MTIKGNEAHTIAGRFESSLRLLPADEFPRLAMHADDAVTFVGWPESGRASDRPSLAARPERWSELTLPLDRCLRCVAVPRTGAPVSTPSSERPITEQVRHVVDERGVARITLDRPDVKNAISPDQRDRVIALLGAASADLGVRVVVLGATGDAFCTGADLRARKIRRPARPMRPTVASARSPP